MKLIINQSSLSKVKPEYQKLLNDLREKVENRFGVDLCAYYLLGSVGRGEDRPGISDMDTVVILRRGITDDDEAWEKEIKDEFEPQYPKLERLDISSMEEKEFDDPKAERLRFIFKTDSVLICGQDITAKFSSYPPGLELAKLLNSNYYKALEEIQKDIIEPDEDDRNNPKYVMEYVRWLSKKVLRLCLGIVMVDEPFYTRNMQEMTQKFSEYYPFYQPQAETALRQYVEPTNNVAEALDFINEMRATIYKLADEKLG
ncbi:MAG: nucleotidyltransferase domain-containing protein [Tolypothrix carrinoi HA7290-LM1]|jgi:predicted nucleotidyltransferase|nr:nucleotidyltransferase domain-containing protein [Tolypothrix carrinoi HA7290-LM1]